MSHGNPDTSADSTYGLSALLHSVFDAQQGTPGDYLRRLLQAARLHMGMEIAFISEIAGGQRLFRYVDSAEGLDVITEGTGGPLEESYCQKVLEGRLPELIHDAQALDEAKALPVTCAMGIGAHMSTPIRLSDGSVYGTFCSFSFHANHDLNERDAELMRVFADIAAELIEKDVQQARLEKGKRQRILTVLESNTLKMVWQPIVDIVSNSIVGVESLARFPATEQMTPDQWFEEAASVGLANELEAQTVALGLDIVSQLSSHQYVACNASAEAVLSGAVLHQLQRLPLERVVLEITEHDVIDDYHSLSNALAPLREKGLRLAVDDAGAGYASMQHVLQLRPDLIKLDMSLTRDIDTDIARRSLAICLLNFSDAIGARLVAEGVETFAELDTLKAIGVPLVQGFVLHRPADAATLSTILANA